MALRVSRIRHFLCSECRSAIEAGEVGPLGSVKCPKCGVPQTVPARMADLVLKRRGGPHPAGDFFSGLEQSTGREVDILVLDSETGPRGRLVSASLRIYKTVARLNHPYLQRVFRVVEDDEHPYVVLEPAHPTALSLVGVDPASPAKVGRIMVQVGRGLRAAAHVGLHHMALHPTQLLVRSERTVHVAGFSPYAYLSAPPNGGWTFVGSPAFQAPEIGAGQRPDVPSDIYSLAAVSVFLLSGAEPTENRSAATLLGKVKESIPTGMFKALGVMLEANPSARPATWDEAIKLFEPALRSGDSTAMRASLKSGSWTGALKASKQDDDDRVSGLLDGLASAAGEEEEEISAEDLIGNLADEKSSMDMAAMHMQDAKVESPLDIMTRAVSAGELSEDDLDEMTPDKVMGQ